MIHSIQLKAGPIPSAPSLEIQLTPVTVFVGPNNSGKSLVLREIEQAIKDPERRPLKVLNSITASSLTLHEIDNIFTKLTVTPMPRGSMDIVHLSNLDETSERSRSTEINRTQLYSEAAKTTVPHGSNLARFLSLFTTNLSGTTRLALSHDRVAGDLQRNPQNALAYIFQNNTLRERFRQIIFDAFQKHIVVDATHIGHLRCRLSDRKPIDESEERGWTEQSVNFHAAAPPLVECSDGMRAFVGILIAMLCDTSRLILIDEPEAFLHPDLAARLGKFLASEMTSNSHRLFVSTHSAQFLMGCVQAGIPFNIIRLTYDSSYATARLLASEKISVLMRNPLLRSTGILNAVFYKFAVVTEGDTDRAFYQEINERLLASNDKRGIPGCLFLNAQNKQTVWDVIRPLRELGIAAAGIVDIDIIKEGGGTWLKPLKGAFFPTTSHEVLQKHRENVDNLFTKTGKDMKQGGIDLLNGDARNTCEDLLRNMAEYGVFVVRIGEVEAWLSSLDIRRSKHVWLQQIFERLGENPKDPNYVNPSMGDVWDFVGNIGEWMQNPNRKGIPE